MKSTSTFRYLSRQLFSRAVITRLGEPLISSLRYNILPIRHISSSDVYREQENKATPNSSIPKEIIFQRIFEVLKNYGKVDKSKITEAAHFSYDLKLDSLDTVEVVMAIEEEFSIEIPDHDADNIKTVAGAINYIASRADAH